VVVHEGFHRCTDWRPLTAEECRDTVRAPTTGMEYFNAVGAVAPKYYWRTSSSQQPG
jgi:hypothetical protein